MGWRRHLPELMWQVPSAPQGCWGHLWIGLQSSTEKSGTNMGKRQKDPQETRPRNCVSFKGIDSKQTAFLIRWKGRIESEEPERMMDSWWCLTVLNFLGSGPCGYLIKTIAQGPGLSWVSQTSFWWKSEQHRANNGFSLMHADALIIPIGIESLIEFSTPHCVLPHCQDRWVLLGIFLPETDVRRCRGHAGTMPVCLPVTKDC